MNINLRQALVGSSTGRLLSSLRDRLEIFRAPREQLGTIANDQMALRLLVTLCRPSDVFVDIGAHIGSVIAEVFRNCPGTKIVAFEAIPEKAANLRKKFPQIVTNCCALADRDGVADFFVDLEQSGFSSLASPPHRNAKISVELKRLDDLLEHADVLKIDVEGAELGVLKGGEKLIATSQPLILFESGPQNVLGHTKEAMFEFFELHNYALFAPNRLSHTGDAMTLNAFLDAHQYPRRTTNYFAIPRSKVEEIRHRAISKKRF